MSVEGVLQHCPHDGISMVAIGGVELCLSFLVGLSNEAQQRLFHGTMHGPFLREKQRGLVHHVLTGVGLRNTKSSGELELFGG